MVGSFTPCIAFQPTRTDKAADSRAHEEATVLRSYSSLVKTLEEVSWHADGGADVLMV